MREDVSIEKRSVLTLKGVGPSVASKLEKLGIRTIQDLLFHLPLRYEDRTHVTPIGSLQAGKKSVFEGVIEHSEIRYGGRRRRGRTLLCYISDDTGGIVLRFFHFGQQQYQSLKSGVRLQCYGEVRSGKGSLEVTHPEYRDMSHQAGSLIQETLTPVYPSVEGIHQTTLRKLVTQALSYLEDDSLIDWMPDEILNRYQLSDLTVAIKTLHNPPADIDLTSLEQSRHLAQRRLIIEELLAHQLSLLLIRHETNQEEAIQLVLDDDELERFKQQLDFELTSAQDRVIDEILDDMTSSLPMMRLVQGDVGSGKTVVAAAAILCAVHHGYQVALMAPTEILAEQHFDSFKRWFDESNIQSVFLTGRHKGETRKQILGDIRSGHAKIVIGTHALFQEPVEFDQLALLIVDEQHRFGVHQRLRLREKGNAKGRVPHQLIMTATPIPRSLTMTFYADLDCSIIDEMPEGRRPVSTVVLPDSRRSEVIERIARACHQGEQAYWVCTLIEESESLQCQAAEATYHQLINELKYLDIGLIHGRMRQQEKDEVMASFKSGDIKLLVATTVIEVGVDVPNASLMVIENPERLGLSQLHQLRGRIGRGEKQSACLLMYKGPLSEQAKKRLSILRQSNSGFEIAEQDLKMRGPGEILGTKQTGLTQFKIADLVRDEYLLEEVRLIADDLLIDDTDCIRPLIDRWLGGADKFSAV